eukprot:920844-Rhodomonas_salina.2
MGGLLRGSDVLDDTFSGLDQALTNFVRLDVPTSLSGVNAGVNTGVDTGGADMVEFFVGLLRQKFMHVDNVFVNVWLAGQQIAQDRKCVPFLDERAKAYIEDCNPGGVYYDVCESVHHAVIDDDSGFFGCVLGVGGTRETHSNNSSFIVRRWQQRLQRAAGSWQRGKLAQVQRDVRIEWDSVKSLARLLVSNIKLLQSVSVRGRHALEDVVAKCGGGV